MELTTALHELFGFRDFRAGQRDACEAALEGRDVLVVMPTGSGKSLCYQLPVLLRHDLTLVVSPLVALMQDQVEGLAALGHGERVALVNSQQEAGVNQEALRRAAAGELRLLYVAPERFSAPGFLERVSGMRVGLFVVDEAHCVSQWGHDFRPDYFRLADAARAVGARSLVASTATATPRVAQDVAHRLRMREPLRVATGFDRPDISFAVARPAGHEKRALVAQLLREPQALPAIVYAGTRAGAEEIALELEQAIGERALAYHAGLDRGRRAEVQRAFLADEAPVIVATNAFGMGIDKPDVRSVIHASVPSSLEAYYQEAGRAGRDGLPARAVLLAENRDKALHVHFIRSEEVEDGLPAWLADRLAAAADGDGRYALDAAELARQVGGFDRLKALLGHLARAGVVAPSPSAPDSVEGRVQSAFDRRADALCRASIEDGARARWRQYREIWAYVEGRSCRRRTILRHFGDTSEPAPGTGPCCDACDQGLVPIIPAPEPSSFADLDEAIVSVARSARPAVGRTTCAEILHGARTKKLVRNSYDGLPAYGCWSHLPRGRILARVDELIAEGRLGTSGGPYPVLRLPAREAA